VSIESLPFGRIEQGASLYTTSPELALDAIAIFGSGSDLVSEPACLNRPPQFGSMVQYHEYYHGYLVW
jgi:hypothetical protein